MRLLQRVVEVAARIGEGDDVGAGGLRLQEEAGEIRRVERMARLAENLAAGRLHRRGAIVPQILAERVVGGDEEPGLAALLGHRLAEAVAECVGVVGPVHEIARAFRPGQHRSAGARADHRLVLFGRDVTTASATAEFGRSMMTSTPSVSNQWRAIAAPTSGLFW